MFGSISRPGTSAMFGNVDPSANNEVVYRVPKALLPLSSLPISSIFLVITLYLFLHSYFSVTLLPFINFFEF
jgi:hypothetical protein